MVLKFSLYEKVLTKIKNDEFGKNIVYDDGTYQISINKTEDPDTIMLWHGNKKVGTLQLNDLPYNHSDNKYRSISFVDINKEHKGKGLGIILYQTVLRFMSENFDGIISILQNRSNNNQVPKIYKRLGGWDDEGVAIIPRDKNVKKDELNLKSLIEITEKFGSNEKFIEKFITQEATNNYNNKRHSKKNIYNNIKDDIKIYIEFPNMLKPREYGISTRKKLVDELIKIKDITYEDIFN